MKDMVWICEECGISENKHTKELCSKCYHRKWAKKYRKRPEIKKHLLAYNKEWRKKNPERVRYLRRRWDKKNPEKKREMDKKYREKNREKLLQKKREWSKRPEVKERRRKSDYGKRYYRRKIKDPAWRLNHNIRIEIWRDLKKNKKNINWEKLVGYTKEELKKHLESQFTDEMNWGNYGTYWEIDHFLPRSQLKFTSKNDSMFKVCWSLWNLRPLTISENRSKGNRR